MEILHSDAKRTVIATLDGSSDGDVYCAHLSNDFNVIRLGSPEECLEVMGQRYAELSAVIIDINMAQEDDCRFLKTVSANSKFETIPVLIASRRQIDDSDMRCLEEGAFDFILPPHHLRLTKRRIENAVRMKRATTFYEIESILRQLPSNIFLKDAQGRYVFMTHYWHHLKRDGDPDWTVRGKTDLEIRKDRENAELAMKTDEEIVRTGKGVSYVIESNVDGVHDFMKLIKEPVFDENGNVKGIVALINDVTETELLKRELERRTRTDDLTGLENRRAFYEYIGNLYKGVDYPFALISADCDRLKYVNDTFGHLVGDEYICMAARVLKSSIPVSARAYRLGGDEFMAILPGFSRMKALDLVEAMRGQCRLLKVAGNNVSISFGVSVIEGPGDDVDTALAQADKAMYEDKLSRKASR